MAPISSSADFDFRVAEVLQGIEKPELRAFAHGAVSLLKGFLDRQKAGRITASAFRTQINQILSKLVHYLTGADCVFVREKNTDGSARLLPGSMVWYVDSEGRTPPPEKAKEDGVSAWVLNHGNGEPHVVADVTRLPDDSPIMKAHRITLAKWRDPQDDDVQRFVEFIRAECCVPVKVQSGTVVGGIIAVKGTAYSDNEADQKRQLLRDMQPLLSFLYFIAWQLEIDDQVQTSLEEMVSLIPRAVSELSDHRLLLNFSTLLTCQPGLRWQRAMIFSLHGSYPESAATCVMALGDDGGTDRSKEHDAINYRLASIEDYFDDSESEAFGRTDRLYQLVLSGRELTIPADALKKVPKLHCLLADPSPVRLRSASGEGGGVTVRGAELWLSDIPWFGQAFAGAAKDADRLVVPLINCSEWRSAGFIILDNPYNRRVANRQDKQLTRLIAGLFEPYLIQRGFGTTEWIASYFATQSLTNKLLSVGHGPNDPDLSGL